VLVTVLAQSGAGQVLWSMLELKKVTVRARQEPGDYAEPYVTRRLIPTPFGAISADEGITRAQGHR